MFTGEVSCERGYRSYRPIPQQETLTTPTETGYFPHDISTKLESTDIVLNWTYYSRRNNRIPKTAYEDRHEKVWSVAFPGEYTKNLWIYSHPGGNGEYHAEDFWRPNPRVETDPRIRDLRRLMMILYSLRESDNRSAEKVNLMILEIVEELVEPGETRMLRLTNALTSYVGIRYDEKAGEKIRQIERKIKDI